MSRIERNIKTVTTQPARGIRSEPEGRRERTPAWSYARLRDSQGSTGGNSRAFGQMAVVARSSGTAMMNAEKCVDQVTACLAKASADPEQKDRWLTEAIIWMQRSIVQERSKKTQPLSRFKLTA